MATTFTSQRAGDWSVLSGTASSPWYDNGTQTALNSKPGNGDFSAVVNHAVNIDENTILGDDTAVTRLSGTGTVTLKSGFSFTHKGRVISNNLSIVCEAGSTWSSSGASAGHWIQCRKFTCNGTSGSHVTVNTANLSGTNYGFFFGGAHNVTEMNCTYADFTNFGSTSFFNACGSPFVFDHCTFTQCYKFIHTGSTATDALTFTNNDCLSTRDSISVLRLVGMVAPTGGTSRNISYNYFSHNNEFFGDLTDLQHLNNLYVAPTIVCEFGQPGTTTTTGTNILSKYNVYVGDSWSTELVYIYTAGRFTQNLGHVIGTHAVFGVHNDQAGTLEIDNNIMETGSDSDNGQCVLLTNDGLQTNQTINIHNNIERISPAGTNAPIFVLHAGLAKGLTLAIDHNTLAGNVVIGSYSNAAWCHRAGMLSSMKSNLLSAIATNTKYLLEEGAQQRSARIGADVDCWDKGTLSSDGTATTFTDSTASWSTYFTDNTAGTFYILFTSGPASGLATAITGNSSGTVGTVASWNGGITPLSGNGYKIFQVALYDPANVDYNCLLNHKTTGTIHRLDGTDTTSVAGYDGHAIASGTPGGHDIYANPQFYDSARCLATYDTASTGLNNAAGTAWADTGSTYNVGDIVSVANSGFFGNQTINYRCITSHAPTSVANDKPGSGSAWRTYWEFATVYRIRQDRTIIGGLITWYLAGFAPTNSALIGTGSDGITIGAVPTAPTITSNSGGSTASVNVVEGNTAVTTVTATGDATIAFSITGGADQAAFTINSSSGALAFASAPDYENPTDVGTNNTYVVDVTATNSAGTDSQTITVTVTNNTADDAVPLQHSLSTGITTGL